MYQLNELFLKASKYSLANTIESICLYNVVFFYLKKNHAHDICTRFHIYTVIVNVYNKKSMYIYIKKKNFITLIKINPCCRYIISVGYLKIKQKQQTNPEEFLMKKLQKIKINFLSLIK